MAQRYVTDTSHTLILKYFTLIFFKLKNGIFSLNYVMFSTGNEMNEIKGNFEGEGCPGFP